MPRRVVQGRRESSLISVPVRAVVALYLTCQPNYRARQRYSTALIGQMQMHQRTTVVPCKRVPASDAVGANGPTAQRRGPHVGNRVAQQLPRQQLH